ncbi:reverse transcriptase domain-containing protein [Tanacetum coccineum]
MEEMLYKFIDEGRRENEEMGTFIREFKTTNELLLRERNNSLSGLKFEVYGLSRAINNAQLSDCEVKGPNEVLVETKPQEMKEQTVRLPTPSIPFPHRLEEACTVMMNERCSAVLLNKLPSKEKDPGSFTIPCDIGHLHINNALAGLGASISLMPYTMYEKLGLGEPKPTRMSLELANRSIQYSRGIAENVLIKIDKFFLPIDLVILDMREGSRITIILGRPFLETARAMIDVFNKKITLKVGDEEVIYDVDQSIKRPPTEDDECYGIDDLDTTLHLKTQELLEDDQIDSFLLNNLEKYIDQSDLESCGKAGDDYAFKNPIRRIKKVLEKCKGAIAWKISDIKGISLSFCIYKILIEENFKLVIQPQRRLNPKVQDVVRNKIVRLLDSGLIYPILDSPWVSPIHVVPKKGGMTVVLNDNIELIPSPQLQDGAWFFQIPITPEDQEKTTFTCPYGTFAYRRMPFGLCNDPETFQRCMTTIFHDMVKEFMQVFRDDFSVFGNSFDQCLDNLDTMLARCEETNLVLNWEKCHFMVKEGIVLGHKISGKGNEVDKAKIDVIAKLPYPTNSVRSFLGHAGFYRRFIKEFSMISKPMNQLLMKDAKFDFF